MWVGQAILRNTWGWGVIVFVICKDRFWTSKSVDLGTLLFEGRYVYLFDI